MLSVLLDADLSLHRELGDTKIDVFLNGAALLYCPGKPLAIGTFDQSMSIRLPMHKYRHFLVSLVMYRSVRVSLRATH